MSVIPFNRCQDEPRLDDDPVGQAIAACTSAVEHLGRLAIKDDSLARMSNVTDFDHIRRMATLAQLIASRVSSNMEANACVEELLK